MTATAAPPLPAREPPPVQAQRLLGGSVAVLERDFLAQTSRPRFLWLRSAIVFLVVGAAVIYLLAEVAGSATKDPTSAGAELFQIMAMIVPLLVLLTGPALSADAIAGERSLGTLSLVLASPARPLGLVLAKFASRFAALLVPVLATLPVAALGFLYGGVSETAFLDWILLMIGMAAMVTSAGILASAFSSAVAAAVLGAYLLGVLLPLFELYAAAWLSWANNGYRGSPSPDWFGHNPYFLWMYTVEPRVGMTGGRGGLAQFLCAAAVLTALSLAVATWRLGREAHFESRRETRARAPRRPRFDDPVRDRALPRYPSSRRTWPTTIALAVGGALTFLPACLDWDDGVLLVGLNLGTWIAGLYLLVRASQAFAAERQEGSLAILLTTPLSAASIVRNRREGLLATGVLLLLPPVVLCVLGVVAFDRKLAAGTLLTWPIATAVLFDFLVVLGLRISVSAATAGKAVLFTVGGFFVGLAVHAATFIALVTTLDRIDDEVAAVWGTFTPPAWVGFLTAIPELAVHVGHSGNEGLAASFAVVWCVLTFVVTRLLLASTCRALARNRE